MNEDLLTTLQTQIEKVSRMGFYKKKLDQAGLTASSIQSWDDFQKIPFTTSREILEELKKQPSECSLYSPEVTRVNFSPSGKELFPVYNTNRDLQKMHEVAARAYEAAGITRDDICAVTFGYHLFIAGLYYQSQLEFYGAKVIPLGPGESERAAEVINKYGVTVLISNPTFAMKLAAMGIPSVRLLFVGGEPFTSVEGYPEKVRSAFGRDIGTTSGREIGASGRNIGMIDSYGMALCSPIARSCRFETGMHILDDFIYAEVIDPLTGNPLPFGEKGELVLTNLHKEAAPLLRYRTGDLTYMVEERCPCGRSFTIPKGIFGRTDEMLKIKGVKFWPSQIGTILHGIPGAGKKYKVVVRNPQGVDTLTLTIEGRKGEVDLEELSRRLKKETLLTFNEIILLDQIDAGPIVEDRRQGRTF